MFRAPGDMSVGSEPRIPQRVATRPFAVVQNCVDEEGFMSEANVSFLNPEEL